KTVDGEAEQVKQQKLQTVISIEATVLSAFLGQKAVNTSSMGKATSAVRGLSRTMKEGKDVDRAEENVEALKRQLTELEEALQQDIHALTTKWDVETIPLETIKVRPKKSNISTTLVSLTWVPFWREADGRTTPAWC
ncbi:MAG: ATP-binding protein, partial [Nitrospira sp.]|nr:ATP-binding protein [Nitrospira sp.]